MISASGIYEWFSTRRKLLWGSLAALTVLLGAMALTLSYNEDISDFLPLGTDDSENLAVYRSISGADDIYILFTGPQDDPDRTVEAMESFTEDVHSNDTEHWCGSLSAQFDYARIREVSQFVNDNMPYFLSDADYARMDSLLAQPGYMRECLARDKQMLMFPTGGMMEGSVERDPLGLFAPVMADLGAAGGQNVFEIYDGCIFTPDMSRAVAMMDSPFGNSETERNTRLVALLEGAAERMNAAYPDVQASVVGGPAIAVGNSSRIKKDSVIAISLSAILIMILLLRSFSSMRNILLILLSIGWGLLFALGGMALFKDSVSIIVIGISSVILGIAVNYPLHLVAHTAHEPRMKEAMKDIMAPLVVGNITTVGAFLALVPLQSTALADLGLFASLLLVGTILFVILYLPHMIKVQEAGQGKSRILDRLSRLRPERSRAVVWSVAAITLLLGFFSLRTGFDPDLSHINYMTQRQRSDMEYFQSLFAADSAASGLQSIYVVSKGADWDEALGSSAAKQGAIDSLAASGLVVRHSGVGRFLSCGAEQRHRLELWRDFCRRHRDLLVGELALAAAAEGFSPTAFSRFTALVDAAPDMQEQDMDHFAPLTQFVLSRNVTELDGRKYVVDLVDVEKDNVERVKGALEGCFDVGGMNSALAGTLSDNFNYIGLACSLIVFFFLWFSFGRVELALISFLPMAVSWLWILGIMALAGIKFNIVNIILATFIFGQGDDYTIFITEGCQWEYARGRSILPSHKNSILRSAVIMFVGIGTLIVARHPAMRSLAQVTIIGMFSVVLMAYLIPPLLFNWLTTSKGRVRRHPVTLKTIFAGCPTDPAEQVAGRYIYKGMEISRSAGRSLRHSGCALLDVVIPDGSEYAFDDPGYGESALLLALTHPGARIVATVADEDRLCIATVAAEGFVDNIEFNVKQ